MTIDPYSHLIPGLQELAAEQLDRLVLPEISGTKNVVKEGNFESAPHRNRTCNLLIKRDELAVLPNDSQGHFISAGHKKSPGYYLIYYLVPYGVAELVGKMLAKTLSLIWSVTRRDS